MFGRSCCHLFHRRLRSSGMLSSQPNFKRLESCKISFPASTKGATIPNGSYSEHTVERIPRFVAGLSLGLTRKPNWSVSTNQRTPRAFSDGNVSQLRSTFLRYFECSESGIEPMTSGLLLTQPVKRKLGQIAQLCGQWDTLFDRWYGLQSVIHIEGRQDCLDCLGTEIAGIVTGHLL